MTEFITEASDTDLAGQALPADDSVEEPTESEPEITADADANIADVVEQHQSVPSGEDDYAR